MSDELLDICDEDNNLTGESQTKSTAHREGLRHRTVHVCVYNDKGEILLQKRADNKDIYPGLWDMSVAGHVSAGEEPVVSASRELAEEIGIQVEPQDLVFSHLGSAVYRSSEINEKVFYYAYLYRFDGEIEKLKLQTAEVQAIKFFSIPELLRSFKDEPQNFCPHQDYWQKYFEKIEIIVDKK